MTRDAHVRVQTVKTRTIVSRSLESWLELDTEAMLTGNPNIAQVLTDGITSLASAAEESGKLSKKQSVALHVGSKLVNRLLLGPNCNNTNTHWQFDPGCSNCLPTRKGPLRGPARNVTAAA